jgi:hypothetical protein
MTLRGRVPEPYSTRNRAEPARTQAACWLTSSMGTVSTNFARSLPIRTQVGALARHRRTAAHDTDLSASQGWHIVDAVSDHGDDLPLCDRLVHTPKLLKWLTMKFASTPSSVSPRRARMIGVLPWLSCVVFFGMNGRVVFCGLQVGEHFSRHTEFPR